MRFLIRTAFWFSAVLLFLPFGANDDGVSVGPVETFLAARAAVGDLAGFCERQPEACETGRSAMRTITVRARESARVAYDLLEEEPAATAATAATAGRHAAGEAGTEETFADEALTDGSSTGSIPTPTPRAAVVP